LTDKKNFNAYLYPYPSGPGKREFSGDAKSDCRMAGIPGEIFIFLQLII